MSVTGLDVFDTTVDKTNAWLIDLMERCDALRANADEVVCAVTPDPFYAVGLWYEDSQISDEEVREDESDRSCRRAGSSTPRTRASHLR